mmetsp:Transcript_28519/g.37306  ORF Transcript_28519/g.37306 Transcript_28519/m.37306 type:complete len:201 (-) Transcript_28519:232-834(-)
MHQRRNRGNNELQENQESTHSAANILKSVKSRISMSKIRKPTDFFGLTPSFSLADGSYTLPVKCWDDDSFLKIQQRLQGNAEYYLMNYLIIFASITNMLMYFVYMKFSTVAVTIVVGCLWSLHSFLAKHEITLMVGSFAVTVHMQRLATIAVSCTLGIIFFLRLMIVGTLTSIIVCGPHALLRTSEAHSQKSNQEFGHAL